MVCDDSGIRRLVLASGSPRRRQLLSLLGIPFIVKAAGVDESPLPGEPPTEMVLRVSQAKALAVRGVRPDELVIAADTIVVLDGTVLGKPLDGRDAARMLRDLRGRAHWVYSGVSVWHPVTGRMVCELSGSAVWMRDYGDDEIAAYVDSGDPLDKAGAYAIQHPGFSPVESMEGCYASVMGLPLCRLTYLLGQFDIAPEPSVGIRCQAKLQYDCPISNAILGGELVKQYKGEK